mmetsp:Transcript_18479/g.28951  ORF Transcript_18479/g.28951 Transcript_18479/m.28951 type:complete len:247 (-) Transcript_18479:157-897(-)|eukprot:CAMPEP_0201522006 /NCGR_PEP_ID=MMETSP0161_2-20130828/16401_1 /ASSEMBLY_ACC=CAM_ASM_000251 /TAXON_ID=180227 /ORGANISM="Neoparamoeba aestuarina, Strain SoJaBio B1-5/56/2" /LENGTH=246 /DNA_ID=CAMNT_0047920755 /DNA_START=268 /DNA_END=1008 /DNA_ORIENTATION=+
MAVAPPTDKVAEILFDSTLRQAFYNHLDSCLMSELLDLWAELEKFFEATDEQEKTNRFVLICKEFMLPNSPNPINHSYDLLAQLRKLYQQVTDQGLSTIPPDSLEPCRVATLDLLAYTCLPVFLSSDIYQDFKDGTVDSTQVGFSRYKAEQFFGMRIEGPLHRCDKCPVNYGHYRRRGFLQRFFSEKKPAKDKPYVPIDPTPRGAPRAHSNGTVSNTTEINRLTTTEGGNPSSEGEGEAMGIFGLV